MVVDKVIVEKNVNLARNHPARDGRGAFLRPGLVAGAGIFALLRRRPAGHRHSRLSEPANAVPADELFHQPAHGRYSAPARWRAAGPAIRRTTRHRRAPRARPVGRRAFAHGGLQPVADVGLSRHNAALRRPDVFLAKSSAPALRRGRRKSGQIQLAPDRRDQGHRSGQGRLGGKRFPRHDAERIPRRLAQDFPKQLHRHDLRQRAAKHRHGFDRDLSLGRREPGHGRQR